MLKEKRELTQSFINILEGQEINISAASTKIEKGDIYWDYKTENKPLDLYAMDEEELQNLLDELSSYVLDELKREYVGKEISLLDLDNNMQQLLNLGDKESIFNYDTREYLKDSFCYQYQDNPAGAGTGFNFEFKIVKDNEDTTKIIVKVIDITEV
jgi:hypothetical protein